jgi:hypothetical protein
VAKLRRRLFAHRVRKTVVGNHLVHVALHQAIKGLDRQSHGTIDQRPEVKVCALFLGEPRSMPSYRVNMGSGNLTAHNGLLNAGHLSCQIGTSGLTSGLVSCDRTVSPHGLRCRGSTT